jgi:hypothetical protein
MEDMCTAYVQAPSIDNTKINIRDTGHGSVDCVQLAQISAVSFFFFFFFKIFIKFYIMQKLGI